jgi:hypothetical protein
MVTAFPAKIDGINFTDLGKVFNTNGTTILGFGNTAVGIAPTGEVVQVGGYYYAAVDIWDGSVWRETIWRSTSMESGWTMYSNPTSLQIATGRMYGGGNLVYSGSVWHTFYHYAPAGDSPDVPAYYTSYTQPNLPTLLAYAQSADLSTWTVMEAPFKKIEVNPFTKADQIADPYIIEISGVTYMTAEIVDNDATSGYDNLRSQLRLWKYNGTFAQMVSGL